jgi:hypothetical protein
VHPYSRSQISCLELTLAKVPKNAFSYRFLSHSCQEPLFSSQHMHREAQHIYTLINIYSSRSIKDRIFKTGSARFIIMHIK